MPYASNAERRAAYALTHPGHPRRSLAERFWEKVDRRGPDECWPWISTLSPAGYGIIWSGGRKADGRTLLATHVSWELANGLPWPSGLYALHSCDNRPCVNPTHIRPGTALDNARDRESRGRGLIGPRNPSWGKRLGALTDDQVRMARLLREQGVTYPELARRFGRNETTMRRLVLRRNYRHVA